METIHAVGLFFVLMIISPKNYKKNIIDSMLGLYFYDAWL